MGRHALTRDGSLAVGCPVRPIAESRYFAGASCGKIPSVPDDRAHGVGFQVLRDAVATYVAADEATAMVLAALDEAGLREMPRTRASIQALVDRHVVPRVSARVPAARHEAVRDTLLHVAAILGRASASVLPPKPSFPEEAVTQQIGMRGFDEIFVLSTDGSVAAALASARPGARVVSVDPAAAIPRASGTAVVVVDLRTSRPSEATWALVVRLCREIAPRAAVVWGDHASAGRNAGGVTVVHLPRVASVDQLLTVIRLGPG